MWSIEQINLIKENWGKKSIPNIAKLLKKSVNAVKQKAARLKLGRHLISGEEMSFNQFCKAIGQEHSYKHYKNYWPKYGFPFEYKKSINKKFVVVRLSDFWGWAEQNKNRLDFSRFPKGALGQEPSWVEVKRYADIKAKDKYKASSWKPEEDQYLISLLETYQYGYRDIAERLQRTEGAIKRRCFDLGLKMRPVRKSPHDGKWQTEQIEIVKKLYLAGYTPDMIAGHVNKSACAVRGKLERLAAKYLLQPEQKPKINNTGTHYKEILPYEQWPKAELFLKMVETARKAVKKSNQKPIVDLERLRNAFIMAESTMV